MNYGYIFILLATLFFSSMEVALKTVAYDFHPMQLNCTRFLVGGMLLVPFGLHALKKRGLSLDLPAWKGFAGLGFLGLVVSMMLYQVSILYVPASVVSVLFSCNPVLVLAFAFLILRTDIRPQHIIALVLEVVGALVIIDPLHTSLDMRGVALVLLSAATFALYAVLGKKLCARYSGLAVTSFSCVAASAEMLLIMPGKERLHVRAVGAVCAHVQLPQLTVEVSAAMVDSLYLLPEPLPRVPRWLSAFPLQDFLQNLAGGLLALGQAQPVFSSATTA